MIPQIKIKTFGIKVPWIGKDGWLNFAILNLCKNIINDPNHIVLGQRLGPDPIAPIRRTEFYPKHELVNLHFDNANLIDGVLYADMHFISKEQIWETFILNYPDDYQIRMRVNNIPEPRYIPTIEEKKMFEITSIDLFIGTGLGKTPY